MLGFIAALALVAPSMAQEYPKDGAVNAAKAFHTGDSVPVDCISRQIDNGEHKFDEHKNILYERFPHCRETSQPLTLRYNIDETFNCTIALRDELFHLFQLYIHEDSPFSCRVPRDRTLQSHVPVPFNFRGYISESHLDIDSTLNVLAMTDHASPYAVTAFAAGRRTSHVVIDDTLTLQISVRWYNAPHLPSYSRIYSPYTTIVYCFATMVVTAVAGLGVFYGIVLPRRTERPREEKID